MNIPKNLLYTKDHEWVKIDGIIATIGITEHAQSELGDIIFVELPDIEQDIINEEPFGVIEAVKTVADLFAPLSGVVIEINSELEDSPELINTDCYNKGWIIKASLVKSVPEKALMSADQYKELIES